ncbi:VOC family protein [Actinomadura rupiterrae]|uniref:VOC family protein n=1 Tax=Actinomadura rupiterrae TaxID=559627 RepID=UPI0020A516C3|nr:VOC family protein [Actinomadura rupiterrae]MCP2342073.1 catechol 2,3-dioxygenase-like lactoylglutathione lyase family enzyme [Actinomadura rupiterrae]
MSDSPRLDGVHHIKLPVRDLQRTRAWYESRLGYVADVEYVEKGELIALVMRHPNGGPLFAFQHDPEHAEGAAGFDYFAIGVPDQESIEALAETFTALGEEHTGVHFGSVGWNLTLARDPDGHQLRFYTTEHHTEMSGDGVTTLNEPRAAFARRERELREAAERTR